MLQILKDKAKKKKKTPYFNTKQKMLKCLDIKARNVLGIKMRNKTVRKGHISQENNNPVYHIIAEFQTQEAKTVELKRSQVCPL